MSFIWADMLWLMALPPILVAAYVLVLRRKKRTALRYANLNMVRAAMGTGSRLRRHLPPVIMLLALALMIAAISRPEMVLTLPTRTSDVILSMDVSGSMRAPDVDPSRMEAAQTAAKNFIGFQPRDVKVGIVAFAGTAFVVQVPTVNREDLIKTIDRLEMQRGTAVGSAILVALKIIFPDARIDLGILGPRDRAMQMNQRGAVLGQAPPQAPAREPVLPGSYENAIIILLTDGNTNTGADPIAAARLAADYGVKVFTVGFGSKPGGGVAEFGGFRQRSILDEESLRQVAEITRGAYFHASTTEELTEVYKSLNRAFLVETKKTEVTAFFAAAAALLTLISVLLSMLWFNRVF